MKICVKRKAIDLGPLASKEFYRINLGHLTVAWEADRLLWTIEIVINDHQAIAANSPPISGCCLIIKLKPSESSSSPATDVFKPWSNVLNILTEQH